MKLPGRHRRSKKAKALDTAAALATAWTETKIVKSAGKGVAKGGKSVAKGGKRVAKGGKGVAKDAKKASSAKGVLRSTPVKVLGALALVGGLAAAVARKLKGGEPDPFTSPYEPADAAAPTNGGAAPPVGVAPVAPDLVDASGTEAEPAVPQAALADEPEALEEPATPVAEEPEPAAEEPEPAAEEPEPAAEEPEPAAEEPRG